MRIEGLDGIVSHILVLSVGIHIQFFSSIWRLKVGTVKVVHEGSHSYQGDSAFTDGRERGATIFFTILKLNKQDFFRILYFCQWCGPSFLPIRPLLCSSPSQSVSLCFHIRVCALYQCEVRDPSNFQKLQPAFDFIGQEIFATSLEVLVTGVFADFQEVQWYVSSCSSYPRWFYWPLKYKSFSK